MEHPIIIDSSRNVGEVKPIIFPNVRRVQFPLFTISDNPEIKPFNIDFKKLMAR